MGGRIIILGAAGCLGRAAAEAFRDSGWMVASLVRSRSLSRIAPGTEPVEVDARDGDSVIEAARGADIILNALNQPYTEWARFVPPFTETAIAAARTSGATLIFPGNLYNYGSGMPAAIDETTPMRPTSRKGQLRVEVESHLRMAAEAGVRTIVLRAGDFYGGRNTGSWLDRVIVKNLRLGRITYPGPLDIVHAWAYLPDLAAAMVQLAAMRKNFEPFETFGFAGHAVTGRELVGAILKMARCNLRVGTMPWWLIRTFGPVVPVFRELAEIAYLWREPHRIAGDKLKNAIGHVPSTPLETAVAAALHDLGFQPAH